MRKHPPTKPDAKRNVRAFMLQMPENLHKNLKITAAERGLSMNAVATKLIKRGLSEVKH